MFLQIVSVVGAIMVLGAYLAHQTGKMGREDRLYSLLNFVGAALLAWVATIDQRWGFIALEVIWALISLPPLIRPRRRAS